LKPRSPWRQGIPQRRHPAQTGETLHRTDRAVLRFSCGIHTLARHWVWWITNLSFMRPRTCHRNYRLSGRNALENHSAVSCWDIPDWTNWNPTPGIM